MSTKSPLGIRQIQRNDRFYLFKLGFEGRHFRRLELLPVSFSVARVALAQLS
jgi:hypothetical protein